MSEKNKEKLGVLIPGMGSVASTFICGVIACNRGLSKPIGSMTQMGSIRLGKRTENRNPLVKDFVPTVDMNNLVFTGWDINQENVYDIALKSKVLKNDLLEELKPDLQKINVLKGVFDEKYVRYGTSKSARNWSFKKETSLEENIHKVIFDSVYATELDGGELAQEYNKTGYIPWYRIEKIAHLKGFDTFTNICPSLSD